MTGVAPGGGPGHYADDVAVPGELRAVWVRAEVAAAQLVHVDVGSARAAPGVAAVLTGGDVGALLLGRRVRDYPLLAVDQVRFHGQPIALIAATTADAAATAARLVRAEYAEHEAVFDAATALGPGSPLLHPDYASYRGAVEVPPGLRNVQGYRRWSRGDAAAGFAACDEVVEAEYRFPRQHAAPIEPHSCLAIPTADGVEIHTTNKEPADTARAVAEACGLAPGAVVVRPVRIGGDFGSKGALALNEVGAALLARATGAPVRLRMAHSEMLASMPGRHAGHVRLRTGLRGGRLWAVQASFHFDGGAFAGAKPGLGAALGGVDAFLEPYDAPHRDIECVVAYTNNPPSGHARSPGEVQACFAGESHLDVLAGRQGSDPAALRRALVASPAIAAVLDRAMAASAWGEPRPPGLGVGMALGVRGSGAGSAAVGLHLGRDGRCAIHLQVPDQGSGVAGIVAAVVHATLGVADDRLDVLWDPVTAADVHSGAGASRVTRVVGHALADAAADLKAQLGDLAARWRNEPASAAVAIEGAAVRLDDGAVVPLADLLDMAGVPRLEADGAYDSATASGEPDPATACLVVQVALDGETGGFEVQRAILVCETGTVLNPNGHRGQLEGGFAFGFGQALMEEQTCVAGAVRPDRLGPYRLPRAADLPSLEVHVLSGSDRNGGPLGAKAVGELVNPLVAPAIANAIADAGGGRVMELPLTPERVWRSGRSQRARP